MCTITLEYNRNNALARRKLAHLLATGLFRQIDEKTDSPSPEQLKAHRELRDDEPETVKFVNGILGSFLREEVKA